MSADKRRSLAALRRYLAARGELAGGVVYRAAPAEKPAAAPVKAAPAAASASKAAPAAARASKTAPAEGFSRDTRTATQASLFAAPAAAPDLAAPDVGGLDLEALRLTVSGCRRCGLGATRTNTVFADGSPQARIVFVGEAPGRDEDLRGLPFVGRAGQLLDRILDSIGFSRREVYITNILKCRPPGNRDPNEEEVAACEGYLARQIEIISPVLICALGRVAGQNLLGTHAPLRILRGGGHRFNGIRVFVTYHPAALLRNPNLKRDAWEDMQALKKLYDELTGAARDA